MLNHARQAGDDRVAADDYGVVKHAERIVTLRLPLGVRQRKYSRISSAKQVRANPQTV
jgi:hypothetical protein